MKQPIYETYTFGELTFVMRRMTGRDILRVTGKLAILPDVMDGPSQKAAVTIKSLDMQDQILALCSVNPKITLDSPDPIPQGTLPVGMIPDDVYGKLMAALCADSGYSTEAADEIRPSSATVAAS